MSTSVATRIVLSGITDTGVTDEVARIIRDCGYSLLKEGPAEIIVTNDEKTAQEHLEQNQTSKVVLLFTGSNDGLEAFEAMSAALSEKYPQRIRPCQAPEFRDVMSSFQKPFLQKEPHFYRRMN